MNKIILIGVITTLLCVITYAQQEKYTTPVNWERYKVSKKEVSILLPKKPIFYESIEYCSNIGVRNYFVYAEGVVYKLEIVSKSNEQIPTWCGVKIKFGKDTFDLRLNNLKSTSDKISEREFVQGNRNVLEIKGKKLTQWIFNDLNNDQWIELSVTHRVDVKFDEMRFVESLIFDKKTTGIEIGNGSGRTFGDETGDNKNDEIVQESGEKAEGIIIVAKPRPNYTDDARQASVQGVVSLRVTFLANGGIGSIEAVNGLPRGLTEQATIAAKKMIFLPARKNGKSISVTKIAQYTFTIY